MEITIDRYGEKCTVNDKRSPAGSAQIRFIDKDRATSTDKLVKLEFVDRRGNEKKYELPASELSEIGNPAFGLKAGADIPDFICVVEG